MKAINKIVNFYRVHGFTIWTIHADPEFEALGARLDAALVTVGCQEHVVDVERMIRTIKERMRAIRSSLPFKKLPKGIVRNLYRFVIMWLNAAAAKNGCSRIFSPRQIVTGSRLDASKHAPAMFGGKCEVHDHPTTTNNTGINRTTPAVFLGATGNTSGTCRFLSLLSGGILRRNKFDLAQLSALDVARVEELAQEQDQPEEFEFYLRDMSLLKDDDPLDPAGNVGVGGGEIHTPTIINPPFIPTDADVEEYDSDGGSLGDSLIEDSDEGEVLDDKDDKGAEDDLQDESRSSDDKAGDESAEEPVVLPDSDDEDSDDDEDSTQGDLDHDQVGVGDPAQAGVTNQEEQDTAEPAGVEKQGAVDDGKPAGVELQDATGGDLDAGSTESGGVITRIGRTIVPPKNYAPSHRNEAYNLASAGDRGPGARGGAPMIIQFRELGVLGIYLSIKGSTFHLSGVYQGTQAAKMAQLKDVSVYQGTQAAKMAQLKDVKQGGPVLTHINGLNVAGLGVAAVNSTIREAVSSIIRPVKITFERSAGPVKAPAEAASLPPKRSEEDKALEQAITECKNARKTVRIMKKKRRRKAREKAGRVEERAATTNAGAPSGTAPHADDNIIYGFANAAVSLDCKPLLSPGEIPPKYEGIVKGMSFAVDEHTKLCNEEYGQQALLTI